MIERPFTQEQLHELRRAAELAWGDDSRHIAHRGHSSIALGQCYVTAAWLRTLYGGHVAHKDGHFVWLSPNKLYGLDLTGDGPSEPVHHAKVIDSAFSGCEVIEPPANARAALFCRRADRALAALRAGHKLSLDVGDAYPGEAPQFTEDHNSPIHDDPFASSGPVTYNVVYAQGEVHVSAEDSHDDLSRHALIEPNHTGPFAAGYVTVDAMDKANWQLRSNIALHALMRVLKDYGKTVGWQWGGLVDLTGQPVNDNFAPKRSQTVYYAYFDDDLLLCRERVIRDVQSSLRDDPPVHGIIEVRGDNAIVNGLIDAPWMFESFKEWTDDEGLTLVAGDNVIRTIEDLQQFNLWSPTNNEPEGTQFFHDPHHDERDLRGPGGVYKCPDCERICHDYRTLSEHQCVTTPENNSSPDIDPAHSIPPIPEGGVSFGGEMSDFNGNHVAASKGDAYCPHCGWGPMRPRQDHPVTEPDFVYYVCSGGCGMASNDEEPPLAIHHDPTVLKHPDPWMDNEPGTVTMPPHWGRVAVIRTSETDWHAYMGGFKVGSIAVHDGVIDDLQGESHVTDALINRVQRSQPHLTYVAPTDEWVGEELDRLTRMGFHRVSTTRFRWAADSDPSKELEGAIPFIFDVQEDKITTGAPGGRHSDITGRFTPAGIVEGLYEPGGKVIIRTITNMPYTVRHLLELWYYTNPQYVIKSVHLRDDEGQDTKLAGTSASYYHVAPRSVRHAIETDQALWAGESPDAREQGVYLFDHPDVAHDFGRRYHPGGYDVWQADLDPEDAADLTPDPLEPGGWMHPTEYGEALFPISLRRHSAVKRAAQEIGQYVANLVASDDLVYRVYQALSKAGGRVYAVGGVVRDALLGKEHDDIDLMALGLTAEQVIAALKRLPGKLVSTGHLKDDSKAESSHAKGVFHYREGGAGGREVQIGLPRRERSTGARHEDFEVNVDPTMTPQEDLYRRDFTPNAMAVDLDSGKLIDPFGGADDIGMGRFRTLSPTSLEDDPLRSLRALGLRGRHGLEPDLQTRRDLALHAPLIEHLPAERIQQELNKIFSSDDPASAMLLAHETGILREILPEVDRTFGYGQDNPHHEQELGLHHISVLRNIAKLTKDPVLRLAAFQHDIGKLDSRWNECVTCTQREAAQALAEGSKAEKAVRPLGEPICHTCGSVVSGHYYPYQRNNPDGSVTMHGADHAVVGADQTRNRAEILNYPLKHIARMGDLVRHHMYPPFTTEKGARRFLSRVGEHADDLLLLRRADQGGLSAYPTDPTGNFNVDREQELIDAVRAKGQALSQSHLAINGHDLIQSLGMEPGPQVGAILQGLTDAVLDDPSLNERATLLQRAQAMLQGARHVASEDDGDGDAWVTCDQGHKHWGQYGAAGLFARHVDDQGTARYYLAHRSILPGQNDYVQHPGTWSTPGGAMDSHEEPHHTAVRETAEEIGHSPAVTVRHVTTDDHGGWAYHTVHADAAQPWTIQAPTWETDKDGWFTPEEIDQLPLHPGFAAYWKAHRGGGTHV